MLKRKIAEQFPVDTFYYNKSKHLIVHCNDMNPCEYAIAVLEVKDQETMIFYGDLVL